MLLLCASPTLASTGPIPLILGPKGPVSLPTGTDSWGAFRMPSGMAWNLDHRVDLHAFVFAGSITMRNPLNDYEKSSSSIAGSAGVIFAPGRPVDTDVPEGEAVDVPQGALQRFTFGFGIYPDMGGGGDTTVRYTTFPQGVKLKSGITFVTGAFNVSYRPTKWFAVGLGLHAIYGNLDTTSLVGGSSTPLDGSPTINGVAIPGNPSYADFLNLFASDAASDPTTLFETNLSTVQFSGIISFSLRPTDWFAIGISYRPRSWDPIGFEGEASIDATATFAEAIGGLDPVIRDLFLQTLPDGGNNGFVADYDVKIKGLYVPRQARLSMVFRPHDRVLLATELTWIEWHRAFKHSKVELSNGNNTDLNFVIGTNAINSTSKRRWRNTWTLSLYSAVAVTDDLTLRAGGSFQRNLINGDYAGGAPQGAVSGPMVSFGAGYWLGNWEFSTLVEHGFHTSTHGRKAEGLLASQSYYSGKQWFFHFGASYLF